MRFLILLAPLLLAACADGGNYGVPVASEPVRPLTSSFSQAGGITIPSDKPDAEAIAYASRCGGTYAAASVQLGMSECSLIRLKGTPSRVVSGLDQSGHAHNAIWYVEGGRRTVYKFDDDKLIGIIR